MRCAECGFDNPQVMMFCGQCGHPLKLICPLCNFENPSNFKFCGQCASNLVMPETLNQNSDKLAFPKTKAISPNKPSTQLAERRQITVLFSDVVGSSQLSERLDPEDLRDIMRAYRYTCNKVLKTYSGYIAQYLGDGILAYYGFPIAHESDAINAVNTAYELIKSLEKLNESLLANKGITLSIRIGIHTGEVVIGEIGGGDKRITALGQTPNIAARLQDLAEPNTIVISSETHHLVSSYIDCTPLGKHHLKGFTRKFSLYKVIKPLNYSAHVQYSNNIETRPPLIGREQESQLLIDKINHANTGKGQVVLLRGVAGMGKSRLIQFIRDSNIPKPYYLIESWGSQYYKNSYLYSITETLKYFWNFSDLNNDKDKLTRIETALSALGMEFEENIPLLANLLGIEISSEPYPILNFTPAQHNQKTLAVLLSIIKAMAKQRLVVIIIEDLHWIDHTSLDFVGLLIGLASSTNIFVILSYRENFMPPWPIYGHVTQISINPLTRDQAKEMINGLSNNKKLPSILVEEIANKTDGIPFFIDELTKMVLASGMLKELNESYELCEPISNMSIPATLQDSLMEKLDKLGPDKSLAQLSAALGREFGHNLLKAVASANSIDFESQISNLVYSELLYRRGLPPHASYTFQHALVQELAYHSLLRQTRQKYNRLIADTLIQQFPDRIREHPEILAHHCYEAGDTIESIKHMINAGKLALDRSALIDAIVHLNKALEHLSELPESKIVLDLEIAVQSNLGSAYMLHLGYGASEVQKAFARAHELCKNSIESAPVFPVLSGLWEYYIVRADIGTAHDIATQLESITTTKSDASLIAHARRLVGGSLFWQGKLNEAKTYLQSNNKLMPKTPTVADAKKAYSQDSEVARLANLACVSWLMGRPSKAINISKQAIELAMKLKHPFSIAYALDFSAIVYQLCGNTKELSKAANELVEISRAYEFNFWNILGLMLCSWTKLNSDTNASTVKKYRSYIKQYNDAGCYLASTYFNALLIQAYIDIKEYEQALKLANNYLDSVDNQEECLFKAEYYRLLAKILLSAGTNKNDIAQDSLLTAISISREQGAKSLELRATRDYCELLKSQNQIEEAKRELKSLLEQFPEHDQDEMNGFQDWKMAKQLLSDLECHKE